MGGAFGFLWRTAKDGYSMSQKAFSSFNELKKILKFGTMTVLLFNFFAGFPILLVLYYFNWTRYVLHIILRFAGLEDTAIQM